MHKGIDAEQFKPQKGEVTVEKAVEACEHFLRLVKLPLPKGVVPGVSRLNGRPGMSKPYLISYEPIYEFAVRADTGKVLMFSNNGRELEYARGKRQKAPYAVNDPINAKGYASTFSKLLGFGDRYRISDFKPNLQGDPDNIGLNRVGLIRLQLEAYEHGFPLAIYDSCSLSIDPVDGVLMSFGVRQTPYKIESYTAKLSIDQARSKAASTVKEYGVGTYRPGYLVIVQGARYGDRLWPAKTESRLQYVCPNGVFGGLKYDEQETPKRLRLAWVLYYPGDEAVFVDAGDGRILGGISKVMN